eukprot:2404534-Rhodomonas_salina.2
MPGPPPSEEEERLRSSSLFWTETWLPALTSGLLLPVGVIACARSTARATCQAAETTRFCGCFRPALRNQTRNTKKTGTRNAVAQMADVSSRARRRFCSPTRGVNSKSTTSPTSRSRSVRSSCLDRSVLRALQRPRPGLCEPVCNLAAV